MTSLHPTPTRVALLQAVADGAVTEKYDVGRGWYAEWDLGPGVKWPDPRFRKVTAAMSAFSRAGWVDLPARPLSSDTSPRLFAVAYAGRAVLDEAARS